RRLFRASGHGDHSPVSRVRRGYVPRWGRSRREDRQGAARRRAARHRDAQAERIRGAPGRAPGRAHPAGARHRGEFEESGERPRGGDATRRGRVPAEAFHGRSAPGAREAIRPMTTSLLDTSAAVRACVFSLAGQTLAIDVTQVREVAVFEDWTIVPLAPPHLVGVANLRGDVVPIADARALLGLPARRGARKLSTLLVAAEGIEVALVIDGDVSLEAFGGILAPDESSPEPHARWALGFLGD